MSLSRVRTSAILALLAIASVPASSVAVSDAFSDQLEAIDEAMERNFAEAESLATVYLDAARRAPALDPADLAALMSRLVVARDKNGRVGNDTAAMARRVVALQDSIPGFDPSERIRSRGALADILRKRRECAEALETARAALDLAQEQGLEEEAPSILGIIGSCSRRSGDYERSESAYLEAIEIESRVNDEPTLPLATLHGNLGNLYAQLGAYTDSKRQMERAIEISEGIDGVSAQTLRASVHRNLSVNYSKQNQNAKAIAELERTLAIYRDVLRPDHPRVALALTSVANNARALSDFPRALEAVRQALEIFGAAGGSQASGQVRAFFTQAAIAGQMGDLDLFERTLTALHDLFEGEDVPDRSRANYERRWGELRMKQGRLDEALEHLRTALTLTEDTGGQRIDWYLPAAQLALCYFARGEYEEARGRLETIISKWTATGGVPRTAVEKYYLALCYKELGDAASALEAALASEDETYAQIRGQTRGLPESTALTLVARRYLSLDLAISLLGVMSGDEAPKVWERLVRSRALVFEELAARTRGLQRSDDPHLQKRLDQLARVRERLANAVIAGPGSAGATKHREELEQLTAEKERLELELAEESPTFQVHEGAAVSGDEVRASIPDGAALVSYVKYERHVEDGNTEPSYMAFVLTQSACSVRDLGSAEDVEREVAEWWQQAAYGGTIAASQATAADSPRRGITKVTTSTLESYNTAGGRLRERIWDPLQSALEDAQTVYLVPDGALHSVSFASLPDGHGSFLIESGPLFHTISAERDLASLTRAANSSSGRGLLAMGGADFDLESPPSVASHSAGTPAFRGRVSHCGDFSRLDFIPLKGSEREVAEISEAWTERRSPNGGGDTGEVATVLTGSEATEGAFKAHASGHRVLHLATHGFFLGGECLPPMTRRGELFELDDQQTLRENPLLVSGLALAGANRRDQAHRDQAHEEDGILTAEEIAALDLQGVEWAILSACETGAGTIQSGEGVLGLRRTFAMAGVRTVIMSLWSVDDEAARAWMNALYEARFAGGDTAEAVRDASLAILRERRDRGEVAHPFYWAPFVAAGDWR